MGVFSATALRDMACIIYQKRQLDRVADKKKKVHPQGESFVNLTKTLKIDGFCDFQLSLLPTIGERFREWFEAFLRTRKVGWL